MLPTVEEAYATHSGFVSSLALRVTGRREDVEDIVQDVFIQAMNGWASIQSRSSIKGWLATVTVRTARRRLRRRRVKLFFGIDGSYNYETVGDQGASTAERALLSQVYEALDAVPVDERLAWTLRHIEGETMNGVAAICGCSLSTAKRRVAVAQLTLEERLGVRRNR
ncbi:MAG: sigma-70 family RNA polymerase sigma factor [Myxococcota bacterium]